jgi:hypothetical protein
MFEVRPDLAGGLGSVDELAEGIGGLVALGLERLCSGPLPSHLFRNSISS